MLTSGRFASIIAGENKEGAASTATHLQLSAKRFIISSALCGSLDFMFRGLKFHVWEYHDGVWGAETNIYEAGRSEDIEGDYEEKIAGEFLSWPDMIIN